MSDLAATFDAEPEDAWHPDDPVAELVDNLCRRCSSLGEPRRLRDDATLTQLVDELLERIHRLERHRAALDDRARIRLAMIVDDVVYVRTRLAFDGQ